MVVDERSEAPARHRRRRSLTARRGTRAAGPSRNRPSTDGRPRKSPLRGPQPVPASAPNPASHVPHREYASVTAVRVEPSPNSTAHPPPGRRRGAFVTLRQPGRHHPSALAARQGRRATLSILPVECLAKCTINGVTQPVKGCFARLTALYHRVRRVSRRLETPIVASLSGCPCGILHSQGDSMGRTSNRIRRLARC